MPDSRANYGELTEASVGVTLALRHTLLSIVVFAIFARPTRLESDSETETIEQIADTPRGKGSTDLRQAVDGLRDGFMHQLGIGASRLRIEQKTILSSYCLKAETYIELELNRAYFTDVEFGECTIELLAEGLTAVTESLRGLKATTVGY
jgi:hypothetical protein